MIWKKMARVVLIVGAGLALGVLAVVASWSGPGGGIRPASAAGTCSVNGAGVATVTLTATDNHVIVGVVQVGGNDYLGFTFSTLSAAQECGAAVIGTGSNQIQSLAFTLSGSSTPTSDTITFDQTSNFSGIPSSTIQAFPCNGLPISGTVGGTSTTSAVTINGFSGNNVTVGDTSLDPGGCGTSEGSLTGVSSYKLVGRGAVTLSALGLGTSPVAVTVPVTFQAGTAAETFEPAATATTLDFSQVGCTNAPCSLTVNDSGAALTSPLSVADGQAVVTGTSGTEETYDFSSAETSIAGVAGLTNGASNFYGQAGTYALTSFQNNSQVVAGAGQETYTVGASHTLFQSGTGADSFTVTGNSNTFEASVAGPDTFYDSGPNNILDFSKVGTSGGAPLAINAAGAPESVGGNTVANGHAAVGTATPAFVFLDGPNSTDASNFPTIIGSSDGNTSFLVGGTGGLTLIGRGTAPSPGNSAQFLGGTGVAVNLSSVQQVISTTTPAFQLGSGQVLVSSPGGASSCNSTICDTLESQLGTQAVPSVTPPGITSVTGPTVGASTFWAGDAPETYNFSDAGNGNTFVGGGGQDFFSSAGNQNKYIAGLGSATFSESAPAQGASNTIDFSGVPVGSASGCTLAPCSLTVNVSGTAVGNNQATVLNAGQSPVATYGFSNGGSDFTTLKGASGGSTTFEGGLGSYTYTGQGTGNTLDFSEAPQVSVTSLVFDVTQQPLPLATLNNSTKETFSGITNLVGLAGGGSTFIGGSTGGYTFHGNNGATANQADFSAQGPSTTLTVNVQPTSSSLTPLTGGTVTFSLPGGSTLCQSVPVTVNGGTGTASCSTSALPAGTDQVLAQYTPPTSSGLSGSDVVLTPSGSGPAGPPATGVVNTTSTSGLTDLGGTNLAAKVNNGTCVPGPCTTTIAPGTLTFSQAGGATLCQAPVPGGSTTTENVACSAALPAGTYDILAVYQPSNATVSGSMATPLQVTVSPSELQPTFSGINYLAYDFFNTQNCNGISTYQDCATATLAGVPNGYGGTVTFSVAGTQNVLCTDNVVSTGVDISAQCSPIGQGGFVLENGQDLVAQFTPTSAPPSSATLSGAGFVAPISTSPFCCINSSTTSLSVQIGNTQVTSVVQGLPAILTAQVNSTTANNLPGGQVVFSQAGGGTLCSATVPSTSTTATVECSISLSSVGSADILATYTSSSSGVVYGSADDKVVPVNSPVQTTGTGSFAQDSSSGVVADLSSAPTTTSIAVTNVNGGVTTTPTVDVTVSANQVLVGAASPSGVIDGQGHDTAACSASASFCDTVTGATTIFGSTGGHNSFVAGSTSEIFGDNGSNGGDSIDFSSVPASGTSPLTVNVSGGPVTLTSGTLQNFTASAGQVTDKFTSNGSDFTTFTGSASSGGNTNFLAGPTGGYSFTATGSNDSIDFSTAPPVTLAYTNATDGTVNLKNVLSPDVINGLTNVTGSTQGGNNLAAPTGASGSASTIYSFTANDDGTHLNNRNTFTGGDGVITFISNGNNNLFQPGSGSATINDSTGTGNTVDFTNVSNPVTVDVSGATVSPAPFNNSAVAGTATYDFRSFGTTPAYFTGSPAGTTFFAGTVADHYNGAALPTNPNELSFAHVSTGSALTVCLVATTRCSAANQAVLGSTIEPFSNITVYDGLTNGNTDFVSAAPDGSTFNASGSNNMADFSNAGGGVTVDLHSGTSGTVGTDHINGMTTVIGSSGGLNNFTSGPASYIFTGNGNGNVFTGGSGTNVFTSNGSNNTFTAGSGVNTFTGSGNGNTFTGGAGSDTFSSAGNNNTFVAGTGPDVISDTGTGNKIDFSAIKTSSATPLVVNLSDTQVSVKYPGVGSDTAQVGSVTYDFTSGGPGFTNIVGSNTGNTYIAANGSSGSYILTGHGPSNTADFSANLCGITANMPSSQVTLPSGGTCATSAVDTISGITSIIGAPQGTNTFDGAVLGDSFTAASGTNTLSYVNMTGLQGNPGITVNLVSNSVSLLGHVSDTFNFAPGALTLTGSPGNDTFKIGGQSSIQLAGGGGNDSLDVSQVTAPSGSTTGATVDLNNGSVSSPTIGGVTFTPACPITPDPTKVCVTSVTGSANADTYIANSSVMSNTSPLNITGGLGNDTLSLHAVSGPATVDMPNTSTPQIASAPICNSPVGSTGAVCAGSGDSPVITFTGVPNLIGTSAGNDYVFPGTGTQSFNESGTPGTLDYSLVPSVDNSSLNSTGITVNATDTGGNFAGSVTSPLAINATDTFTNIKKFVGTLDNDTFIQSGPGTYVFQGELGANSLDLSAAPTGATVQLTGTQPADNCTSGIQNNDGTATGSGVNDTFSCIGNVISSTAEYQVAPGQNATINGGGSGTIRLVSTGADIQTPNCGVTVTMPVGTTPGTVQSNTCSDYNFSFSGVTKVYGTPYNDLFVPGTANATLIGNGGTDGVTYTDAPAAAVVNLSGSSYTVPAGYPNAGTVVPKNTAIGGNGATMSLQNIANATATSSYNDILVGGPIAGSLLGGSGDDRFVPTGGNYTINGGTGNATIDLTSPKLTGYTTLNLGYGGQQYLGVGDGSVTLVPGTIKTAIASPGGSALLAGNGDGITLQGSGNDWLAAGIGTQTLIGNGPGNTLVAGIGTDTLQGGSSPVTFVPGQGNDILSSQTTGNKLSYNGVPFPVDVNLSSQLFTVPPGEPGAGTNLNPQTASGGYGVIVNLAGAGISSVVGSSANDIFVTGSTATNVSGNGGDDLFVVSSGGNTLTAANGSSSRFVIDGPGSNVIHGGGASTIDFSQVTKWTTCPSKGVCVTVNLLTGNATGPGLSEAVDGVLNAIGSNGNDVLIAGTTNATMTGLQGTDVFQVSPQGGDTMDGTGGTNDTFCAQVGCNSMSYNPSAGSILIGGGVGNYFLAKNNVEDVIHESGFPASTLSTDSIDLVFNP